MKLHILPKLIGGFGLLCLLVVNVVSHIQGDITTPATYRFLVIFCWLGLATGIFGAVWALVARKTFPQGSSCARVALFCVVVALGALWTFAQLPDYIYTKPQNSHLSSERANKSPEPTAVDSASAGFLR
jgi:hypothetical protein